MCAVRIGGKKIAHILRPSAQTNRNQHYPCAQQDAELYPVSMLTGRFRERNINKLIVFAHTHTTAGGGGNADHATVQSFRSRIANNGCELENSFPRLAPLFAACRCVHIQTCFALDIEPLAISLSLGVGLRCGAIQTVHFGSGCTNFGISAAFRCERIISLDCTAVSLLFFFPFQGSFPRGFERRISCTVACEGKICENTPHRPELCGFGKAMVRRSTV